MDRLPIEGPSTYQEDARLLASLLEIVSLRTTGHTDIVVIDISDGDTAKQLASQCISKTFGIVNSNEATRRPDELREQTQASVW